MKPSASASPGIDLRFAGDRPLAGAAGRCDRDELLDRERFALEVVDHVLGDVPGDANRDGELVSLIDIVCSCSHRELIRFGGAWPVTKGDGETGRAWKRRAGGEPG